MISVYLGERIYLREDLIRIGREAGVSDRDILSLCFGGAGYVYGIPEQSPYADFNGSLISRETAAELEKESEGLSGHIFYGTEGINGLCAVKGIEFGGITSVELPADLFYENEPGIFHDVCTLAARLENRAGRVSRLARIGAPKVIMDNEKRMLTMYLWQLEDNKGNAALAGWKPLTLKNGRVMASLKEAGWSLSAGAWFPEKKAQIDKEYEEFEQMEPTEDDEEDF